MTENIDPKIAGPKISGPELSGPELSANVAELDRRIAAVRQRLAVARAVIGRGTPLFGNLIDDIAQICRIAESLPGRPIKDLEGLLAVMTDLAAELRRHAEPVANQAGLDPVSTDSPSMEGI